MLTVRAELMQIRAGACLTRRRLAPGTRAVADVTTAARNSAVADVNMACRTAPRAGFFNVLFVSCDSSIVSVTHG